MRLMTTCDDPTGLTDLLGRHRPLGKTLLKIELVTDKFSEQKTRGSKREPFGHVSLRNVVCTIVRFHCVSRPLLFRVPEATLFSNEDQMEAETSLYVR